MEVSVKTCRYMDGVGWPSVGGLVGSINGNGFAGWVRVRAGDTQLGHWGVHLSDVM